MKKNKLGFRKTALIALLIGGGSFAHATPKEPVDSFLEWLLGTWQKPKQVVCNDYPECPPDFAPEQDPTKPKDKDKKD
jgi:hypothetical protein